MNIDKIQEEKNQIRSAIRALKRGMNETEKQLEADKVFAKIEELAHFQQANNILIYWSTPDELPTQQFINKWVGRKQILLPRVVGDDIEIRSYNAKTDLKKGNLGIWEPITDDVFSGSIDLVIVPGMAFDMQRNRMGRGKGYYDRFFSSVQSVKWGVCFNCQLLTSIPITDEDVKMDMIISPTQLIR